MAKTKSSASVLQALLSLLIFVGIGYALYHLFGSSVRKGADSVVRIYGNMSCPWTKKAVDYMKPEMQKAPHRVQFVECNDHPDKCAKHQIQGMPTTIHHGKDGSVLDRIEGYSEDKFDELKQFIHKTL